MDLAPSILHTVISPFAAFSSIPPRIPCSTAKPEAPTSWTDSQLNPKNRIDSLSPVRNPRWRIDGATSEGTQFHALPCFLFPALPPSRIDVFLPDQSAHPEHLRGALQSSAAFHTTDRRVERLGIAQYVLRVLESWTDRTPGLDVILPGLPFGSQIRVRNVVADVAKVEVEIVAGADVERQWLSVKELLQDMWDVSPSSWPEIIRVDDLALEAQLHDTVSLVRLRRSRSTELFVFKSALGSVKYLYHELKLLLTMPAHPNIIARPLYIVTSPCHSSGDEGTCGFILQYHPLGSLQNVISLRAHAGTLLLKDQMKWASQITRALLHVKERAGTFYSELKLDNVLLSSRNGTEDVVLVDFEQRGNWLSWSAPEIYHVDIFELLLEAGYISPSSHAYAAAFDYLASRQPATTGVAHESQYANPAASYYTAWAVLSAQEQEAAVVFTLGKVLWCIFEGVANVGVNLRRSCPREPSPEFPEFRKAPLFLRDLIRRCTVDAREWEAPASAIIRSGDRLYPRGRSDMNGRPAGTAHDVQVASKRWWQDEVERMRLFFIKRTQLDKQRGNPAAVHKPPSSSLRPTLRDVLTAVEGDATSYVRHT